MKFNTYITNDNNKPPGGLVSTMHKKWESELRHRGIFFHINAGERPELHLFANYEFLFLVTVIKVIRGPCLI